MAALEATAKATDQTGNDMTSLASSATATTSGWLAVVIVRVSETGRTVDAPTDTAGNTYVAATPLIGSNNCAIRMYYSANITGHASNVVTAHFSSGPFNSVLVLYFSGMATSAPLDDTATGGPTNGVSALTSGTFDTTQADTVVVAAMTYDNNFRTFSAGNIAGGPATLAVTSGASNQGDAGAEYRILTAQASGATASMSLSGTQNELTMVVGAFKQAAGGATPWAPGTRLLMLGVGN